MQISLHLYIDFLKKPQILGVQNTSRLHIIFFIFSIFWQQDKSCRLQVAFFRSGKSKELTLQCCLLLWKHCPDLHACIWKAENYF